MNEHFLTYEQSLAVKELGFEESCIAWYVSKEHGLELGQVVKSDLLRDGVLAPLKSQFFKWVREKYEIDYEITYAGTKGEYHSFVKDYLYGNNRNSPSIFTYEKAEDACINEIIELLKLK